MADSIVWTIYSHTHVESGRRYVGLTKLSMLERWNRHAYNALKRHDSTYFANAIRKYGKDAFSHEVLEICTSLEEANLAEEKWILHFDTVNPEKGFNFKSGGDHRPHPVKNPWDRPDFRERVTSAIMSGLSDPVIAANRAVGAAKRKVTVSDPAFKEAASARCKEVAARPEVRAKMSEAQQVRAQDPEYRKQKSERWQDHNYRKKCSTGLARGTQLLKARTHCPKGHEYTPENTATYTDKNGWESRKCRSCHNTKTRARTPIGPPPEICSKGHALTPDLVSANAGVWRCKQCNRERVASYYVKRRLNKLDANVYSCNS